MFPDNQSHETSQTRSLCSSHSDQCRQRCRSCGTVCFVIWVSRPRLGVSPTPKSLWHMTATDINGNQGTSQCVIFYFVLFTDKLFLDGCAIEGECWDTIGRVSSLECDMRDNMVDPDVSVRIVHVCGMLGWVGSASHQGSPLKDTLFCCSAIYISVPYTKCTRSLHYNTH